VILEDLDRDLRKIVARKVADPNYRDDILQEVRISVWRLAEAHADDPRDLGPFLRAHARIVVSQWSPHRLLTGQAPRERGSGRVQSAQTTVGSLEARIEAAEEDGGADAFLPSVPDNAPITELSVDIERAVSELDPRDAEIVRLHFWHGYTWDEIGSALGMTKSGIATRWRKNIRPRLAHALDTYSSGL